jgi:hypothetical protein
MTAILQCGAQHQAQAPPERRAAGITESISKRLQAERTTIRLSALPLQGLRKFLRQFEQLRSYLPKRRCRRGQPREDRSCRRLSGIAPTPNASGCYLCVGSLKASLVAAGSLAVPDLGISSLDDVLIDARRIFCREKQQLQIRRSWVCGRTDQPKTENSKKPMPVDPKLRKIFMEHRTNLPASLRMTAWVFPANVRECRRIRGPRATMARSGR